MNSPGRSRWVLLLVALAFFAPFVAAVVLHLADWRPTQHRNIGELLAPPVAIGEVAAQDGQGEPWSWENDEQRWTLLVRVGAQCEAACRDRLHKLRNVQVSLGRHADRLPEFLFDTPQSVDGFARLDFTRLPEVFGAAPAADVEAWLVDPHGFVAIRYRAGFDPAGLRRDLSRLIK